MSDTLKIHGNTIIIDHGFGVLSVYCHLHKLLVKENQMVKQGQKIAEMGNTGLVSGPHLHWGLSLQNVRVDPLFWVDKELNVLTFNSKKQ